jgi:signal transduction histidine kinase
MEIEEPKINLSKNIKLNLFRIFQECVSNAIKHGKANTITVSLSIDKHLVLLSIQDDGCGYQLSTKNKLSDGGGLGFISLHERVALLNGQIDFDSLTNHGSSVRVVLPLN